MWLSPVLSPLHAVGCFDGSSLGAGEYPGGAHLSRAAFISRPTDKSRRLTTYVATALMCGAPGKRSFVAGFLEDDSDRLSNF